MMNITIDSLHSKISGKLDAVVDLSRYVAGVYSRYESRDVKREQVLQSIFDSSAALQKKYYDSTAIMLSRYWESDNDCARASFEQYEKILTSENFISSMDHYYELIKREIALLGSSAEFANFAVVLTKVPDPNDCFGEHEAHRGYLSMIQMLSDRFEANKITFTAKLRQLNECECGARMYIDQYNAYKICEECGCEIYMPGTAFDDSQCHQQITKHKRYNPDKHCEKWVDQITATEDVSGPAFEKVVMRLDERAIKEFTKAGKLRSMRSMTCKQIREWLKDYKLTTKWNDHAPLIRKAITALHGEMISPPQITPEEREDIIADFSQDMFEYDEICKLEEVLHLVDRDKIKNKPYYPFGLFKVLCQRLRGDPRLPGLIECIHFQSADTNIKNDKLYKIICQRRGKRYEPTDRTVLVDIR